MRFMLKISYQKYAQSWYSDVDRNTFMFASQFYEKSDGCTMDIPLSIIFSNIYMAKTEREVVSPLKPKFVDGIINRRKYQADQLWIPNWFMKITPSQSKYIAMKESYLFIEHHKFLNGIKGVPSLVIWAEQHVWPVFKEVKSQKLNVSLLMLTIHLHSSILWLNNLVKNLVTIFKWYLWKAFKTFTWFSILSQTTSSSKWTKFILGECQRRGSSRLYFRTIIVSNLH